MSEAAAIMANSALEKLRLSIGTSNMLDSGFDGFCDDLRAASIKPVFRPRQPGILFNERRLLS
jgi:hypothetical protein